MTSYRTGNLGLSIDRPPSLRDRVYVNIRSAILDGIMLPGAPLLQEQLAAEMGVSRTPVRDALDRLSTEGLVTRGVGGQITVAELSIQELREKYAVRQALESLALRLAVEIFDEEQIASLRERTQDTRDAIRRNDVQALAEIGYDFHDTIIAACKNEFLIQTLQNLNDSIRRYRRVAANMPGRAKETLREHEEILLALENGENLRADQLLQEHIKHSQQRLESAIELYESQDLDPRKKSLYRSRLPAI